ncbi:hypothetical protein ZWY2020_039181 [Hordeum vulgare]|nr:hypothetical protein ZWY2020_039181 [Hordeum vulgare]
MTMFQALAASPSRLRPVPSCSSSTPPLLSPSDAAPPSLVAAANLMRWTLGWTVREQRIYLGPKFDRFGYWVR